tara:strand:+ start:157 stop:618 length:462 start_codon:yes stop_codon:yes gene_type:complete
MYGKYEKSLIQGIVKRANLDCPSDIDEFFESLLSHKGPEIAPVNLHTGHDCRSFYAEYDVEMWNVVVDYAERFDWNGSPLEFINNYGSYETRIWGEKLYSASQFASRFVWIILDILAIKILERPLSQECKEWLTGHSQSKWFNGEWEASNVSY